ncbi:MAG: LysR family transcriptional regulator [Eggerthellaceae bacterium]|nr:LysR family transcriptional regulator [Eggerthellaceae bacterium]
MNIDQMRMVLSLSESGNMTTTARKLQVTQPALTYQIKSIESELGFKVFERSRNGTKPTPEGAFLCESLHKVLTEYDEAVRLSRAMAEGISAGMVRVGTSSYSRDTISAFLRAAQGFMGNQMFSLIPCGGSNPLDLLHEGVVDFWSASDAALAVGRAPLSEELRMLPLSEASSMVYVPVHHRLASRDSAALEDLAGETLWLWPRGSASLASDALRAELEQRKVNVDIQDFSEDTPAMLSLLAGGSLAIYDTGYLPPPSHIARAVPLSWKGSDVLGLVYLAREEKRLGKVIEELKEQVAAYEEAGNVDDALEAGRIAAVLDDIVQTICRGGMRDIVPLVDYALELGAPADHILNQGVLVGMDEVTKMYKGGSTFTSEMLASVATGKLAAEELTPLIEENGAHRKLGTAVIGTVKGDRHELGKNLVRIALEGRGIEVHDLGRQVRPSEFVDYVASNPSCNLVLISLFRIEVRDMVRKTMEALEESGLRERVFVMLGGPAADAEFVQQVGADAYTEDAVEAARTAYNFLSY